MRYMCSSHSQAKRDAVYASDSKPLSSWKTASVRGWSQGSLSQGIMAWELDCLAPVALGGWIWDSKNKIINHRISNNSDITDNV